jgi:uncharacterized membrane protein SirB2
MTLYALVLATHIATIGCSGALFFSRASSTLFGRTWPRLKAVRRLSYAIDSVLLIAAITLVCILPKGVFATHWLSVKLALVVVYIAFGIAAMTEKLPIGLRCLCLGGAATAYFNIIGIAMTHSPYGWLSLLF